MPKDDPIVKYDEAVTMMAITEPAPNGKIKGAARTVPNRRDRRKLATRQALLDATRSLLVSRSIDALSVDEIAMRADVAKGTFYNYFEDKDALARELASSMRGRVESEIRQANEGIEDPAARVARAFCCVLRFFQNAPAEATAMTRLFPRATDAAAPMNSGVRADVVAGLASGRIVAPSEDVAVACIVGVFTAGANRASNLSSARARTFARELGTILLHGLGLSRAPAARIMDQAVESILS
ncbi:MAG TPA: TetR/AcrR family transcriptional regulator [Candidatus Binataceae bacterium]